MTKEFTEHFLATEDGHTVYFKVFVFYHLIYTEPNEKNSREFEIPVTLKSVRLDIQ